MLSSAALFDEKLRSSEDALQVMTSDFQMAQAEISGLRESNNRFEIQIEMLQSNLSDASMYKEWYENKSKEYDDLQTQLSDEQRKLFDKDDEIMALKDKLTTEIEVSSELNETITGLKEQIK